MDLRQLHVSLFFLSLLLLFSTASRVRIKNVTLPLVLWHGLGDDCCGWVRTRVGGLVERFIPGIYVKSLMLGETPQEDLKHTYFMNVNSKVAMACDHIRRDPRLRDGYNALGFSQGAQFFRAVIQRCPDPPIHTFISLGGQHQGVYGVPQCQGKPGSDYCYEMMQQFLHWAAYWRPIQDRIVQAQYWHDPMDEDRYRRGSIFLADINNEREMNVTYRENLMKLEKFIMVRFLRDEQVHPRESQWFGFFRPGSRWEVEPLRESRLYKEDRLGLAKMDREGKLEFVKVDGKHMRFTDDWFIRHIIMPYL